jgi:hypothetical protein
VDAVVEVVGELDVDVVVEQVVVEVVVVVVELSLVVVTVEVIDSHPNSRWIITNKHHQSIL